ncbi:MAG: sulfatase [Phycisphaerae bacterium]
MPAVDRPNFLLITTDQQRHDHLACAGNRAIRTPHIDALARDGIRFDSAYVSNPLCMPSRATIVTGRWPHSHRVWCNGVPLSPDQLTLQGLLSRAGYHTGLIGKAHLTPFGAATDQPIDEWSRRWLDHDLRDWHGPYYGFNYVELAIGHGTAVHGHYGYWLQDNHPDVYADRQQDRQRNGSPTGVPDSWPSDVPVEAHHSWWVARRSIEYLRAQRGGPFMLWASFPDPHQPYCPPRRYADMYRPAEVAMPHRRPDELDTKPPYIRQAIQQRWSTEGTAPHVFVTAANEAQIREVIAHTYAMISLIDDCVGQILGELEALGLHRNTVVVFTSDHGDLMGDHWLLNKGPFHYEGLLRVPLIWRWPAGIEAGQHSSALVGLMDIMPTFLAIAGVEPPSGLPGRSILPVLQGQRRRVRDALLIEFQSAYRPELQLRTIRTGPWKLTYYAGQRFGELYNLQEDPHEFVNLYDSPEHRAVREQLLLELLELLVATDDALPARSAHA